MAEKVFIEPKLLEEFSFKFIEEIKETEAQLKVKGINISDMLPEVFKGDSIFVDATYSEDRQHVLFRFKKSSNFRFVKRKISGDVFNVYDPHGYWKSGPVGIKVSNSSINLKKVMITGMKPFEIEGNDIEITVENLKIQVPYYGFSIDIDYGFIFSYSNLLKRLRNIKQFISHFLGAYIEYAMQRKPRFKFIDDLEEIKLEMERLFFDETTGELEIDKYIEKNPIILRRGLDLIHPESQVILEDKLNKYGQKLKPDVIAYNQKDKIWTIVDYKRAKRNVIKNKDTVRTGFKAEIHDLKNQLRDYKEYFEEETHRKFVMDEYNLKIEHPKTLGIIGYISAEEQVEFSRLLKDEPRWFDITPYNYLYDNFCSYIDLVNKIYFDESDF